MIPSQDATSIYGPEGVSSTDFYPFANSVFWLYIRVCFVYLTSKNRPFPNSWVARLEHFYILIAYHIWSAGRRCLSFWKPVGETVYLNNWFYSTIYPLIQDILRTWMFWRSRPTPESEETKMSSALRPLLTRLAIAEPEAEAGLDVGTETDPLKTSPH